MQLTDHSGFAGRTFQRRFSQLDKRDRVKARGEASQPKRGNLPVSIAARSLQKVYLAFKAFKESCAKLCQQHGVVTCCSSEGCIKGANIKSHHNTVVHEG